MRNVIKLLFPRGRAWSFAGNAGQLIDGLGDSLEYPKDALRAILPESLPGTATDTLPEWHVMLGQIYDPSMSVEDQRIKLSAILTSIGGVDIVRLNTQIQKELPNCYVAEPAMPEQIPNCYYVGNILPELTPEEYIRLFIILTYYAPLHLQPIEIFDIILDNGDLLGLDEGDHLIALLALDI